MIHRRALLGATAGLSLAALASGCSTDGGASPGNPQLTMTWWGSEARAKNTNAMVDLFRAQHPTVQVTTEPTADAAYWERLATQTAAKSAPDVIQMSINFLREYADRGALLDLGTLGIDLSQFAAGSADSGTVGGKVYAIATGMNAPVIMANPAVFQQAKVEIPDDTTWTWDTYLETAAAITQNSPDGTYGSSCLWMGPDTMLNAWLRQHGKPGIFDDAGITFTAADVVEFYQLLAKFRDQQAIPPAAQITEDTAKPLEQQLFPAGKLGMILTYTNVSGVMDKATGQDLTLLRPPSINGPATDKQAWYTAAMQWAIASTTKAPKAAGDLVNFLLTSPEAGLIQLADRGAPSSNAVRTAVAAKLTASERKGLDFLAAIEPELGPPSPIPVPGAATIASVWTRHSESVINGTATPDRAASALVDELAAAIKKAAG